MLTVVIVCNSICITTPSVLEITKTVDLMVFGVMFVC